MERRAQLLIERLLRVADKTGKRGYLILQRGVLRERVQEFGERVHFGLFDGQALVFLQETGFGVEIGVEQRFVGFIIELGVGREVVSPERGRFAAVRVIRCKGVGATARSF